MICAKCGGDYERRPGRGRRSALCESCRVYRARVGTEERRVHQVVGLLDGIATRQYAQRRMIERTPWIGELIAAENDGMVADVQVEADERVKRYTIVVRNPIV